MKHNGSMILRFTVLLLLFFIIFSTPVYAWICTGSSSGFWHFCNTGGTILLLAPGVIIVSLIVMAVFIWYLKRKDILIKWFYYPCIFAVLVLLGYGVIFGGFWAIETGTGLSENAEERSHITQDVYLPSYTPKGMDKSGVRVLYTEGHGWQLNFHYDDGNLNYIYVTVQDSPSRITLTDRYCNIFGIKGTNTNFYGGNCTKQETSSGRDFYVGNRYNGKKWAFVNFGDAFAHIQYYDTEGYFIPDQELNNLIDSFEKLPAKDIPLSSNR